MLNKKVLIIIGIIVFVNLGFFVFFRSQNQTKSTPALPLLQSDSSVSSDQPPADQSVASQEIPSTNVDQPVTGQDLPLVEKSAPPTNPDSSSPTTTISGVLIGDGNPWTLIYDDAATGSVAATLELVFTTSSRCDFGQGDVPCDPMFYEVGTGIEVTGQKDSSNLTVSHIKRAVSLIGQ